MNRANAPKLTFQRLTLLLAASVAISASSAMAQERSRSGELAGWGKTSNPDNDCRFFTAEGALLIHVPGGARSHDLAAEISVTNAPRVLQPVKGDFTIQVQVDGRFAPGGESTSDVRIAYNGAGIVAVFNDKNVVTLARAVLQHPDGKPTPYANFEMRVNGELQRLGTTDDLALPLDKPVHLRLERRGQKILGAASTNGVNWHVLEPKELPTNWPQGLQVGVIAISTSREEFNPRFSKLQIVK